MTKLVIQPGIFSSHKVVDRDGVALQPGQRLRIQHCVGKYGETRLVEGELVQVSLYQGIYIKLASNSRPFIEHSVFGAKPYKAGDLYLVANALQYDHASKVLRGYHEHDDVEHGHVAFVKVLR